MKREMTERSREVFIPNQYMNGEGMTISINGKETRLEPGMHTLPEYAAKIALAALEAAGL